MNLCDAIQFLSVFAYTIAPFSVLFILARRTSEPCSWGLLFRSIPWGLAAFTAAAMPVSIWSLKAYAILHAAITIAALAAAIMHRSRLIISERTFPKLPAIIIGASILPLIIPFMPYQEWLGAGDMRFHNILAQSIIENGSIPATWHPFADIPVNYPRGVHLLCAFISLHSSLPVHTVLTCLLFVSQALSTGLIFLISQQIFKNRLSAVFSSVAYAFIAAAGSMDYIRWGGIPNAFAMMLTLSFVLHLLSRATSAGKSRISITLTLIAAAVVLTHHYSALALGLLVLGLIVLTPLRTISMEALINTAIGGITAVLIMLISGIARTPSADTSVFIFHEHPISLLNAVIQLNPAFAVIAAAGLYLILKNRIPGTTSLITSWLTAYLISFCILEYCYRLAVFAVSGGSSFYTALTPSRLIADSAYPLSIAAGALAVHPTLFRYRTHLTAILIAVGLISSSLFGLSLQEPASGPDPSPVIDWLRQNTPPDALLAGNIPHIEYLAWRRTVSPPIPASESRNHPSLAKLRSIDSLDQLIRYSSENELECFLVMPAGSSPAPTVSCVYSNDNFNIFKVGSKNE